MAHQVPIDPSARVDDASLGGVHELLPDLAYRRLAIVNVLFAGRPGAGDRGWVLIDAGVRGSASAIAEAAGRRFGQGARPSAIVLTHGHFDHVGAVEDLARRWGRTDLCARHGASVPRRPLLLPAAGPDRRRRYPGRALGALPEGADRRR